RLNLPKTSQYSTSRAKTPSSFPLEASHNRIVLSPSRVNTRSPFGLKLISFIVVDGLRKLPDSLRVVASQTRTEFADSEMKAKPLEWAAIHRPSKLKRTFDNSYISTPSIAISEPVPAFQILTVPSDEPVTTRRPSGLKAAAWMGAV